MDFVKQVFHSEANFILVEFVDFDWKMKVFNYFTLVTSMLFSHFT